MDDTLHVTRNSFGEIVPVELSDDLSTGTASAAITSDLFIYHQNLVSAEKQHAPRYDDFGFIFPNMRGAPLNKNYV